LYMESIVKERRYSYNSEYDFVFDDGSDDTEERDDEEQRSDCNEQNGSDAQQVRVGSVHRHINDCSNFRINKHPDGNADQRQPAQLTKIHTTPAFIRTMHIIH